MQFKRILVLILLFYSVTLANNDIQILSNNTSEFVFKVKLQNIVVKNSSSDSFTTIYFENADYPEEQGSYALPFRSLNIGVPEKGDVRFEILSQKEKSLIDFTADVTRVMAPDETGITKLIKTYSTESKFKKPIIALGDKKRFRDIFFQNLEFNPVRYNPENNSASLIEEITVKITFPNSTQRQYKTRGKLDALYEKLIINFDTAKKWQIEKKRTLSKTSEIGQGDFYVFDIEQDGIYKISASALQNANIDLSTVQINQLQLYNNGGHTLSVSTSSTVYNYPYTQKTAILRFDLNNNGLFDNNDYILFYGKSVNSWFYNSSKNTFEYQKHPYDTKNTYMLSLQSAAQKDMQYIPFENVNVTQTNSYAYQHYHHERDLYNILSSGPDWYGHRFFGSARQQQDFTFNIDNLNTSESSDFEIIFKGGSAVEYVDNGYYRYTFDVFLNNQSILNSVNFIGAGRYSYSNSFNSSFLVDGSNKLTISYFSNNTGSSAHLDNFGIKYPYNLLSRNDYLSFFTEKLAAATAFTISGLANKNDIYIFDVTDELNPIVLKKDLTVQSGNVTLELPGQSEPKKIIVTSLASNDIKAIRNFKQLNLTNNLLSSSNQADFIIITRNALKPYARELAEMRPQYNTKIVSVDEIEYYFNSGVQDPVAIRNFLKYAYENWQTPSVSYVLLFGDGNYDYRNIEIADSSVVPTFQIYSATELNSRSCDNFFAQLETDSETQNLILPSIALGRIPVENELDAERILDKMKDYEQNPIRDGWQTYITIVGDDERTGSTSNEWDHQRQAEDLTNLNSLNKFNKRKIYLSAYEEIAGGLGRVKPKAVQDLIDQLNSGTLIVNYVGHGNPAQWAHETVFNFDRDYNKINNFGKYFFLIAATCDFGVWDKPNDISFTEALIWKEAAGAIGSVASTRLVYSANNFAFNRAFYNKLFPNGSASIPLGDAMMSTLLSLGSGGNINDQKYSLLADPTMTLADPRNEIEIASVYPDTLKALSQANITARIKDGNNYLSGFSGGASIIVNDAVFENVNSGGGERENYDLPGPLLFKGEVSVSSGELESSFIIPKSIRYEEKPTGRVTVYAWDEQTGNTALGYFDALLFTGSSELTAESNGPEIDIYFEDQENFSSGDIIRDNPVLIAEIADESGINVTGQLGHQIQLQLDQEDPIDVSSFFNYNRDSYTEGMLKYPLTALKSGEHMLSLQVFDNLNNRNSYQVQFRISESTELVLDNVVNYPNPFRRNTAFTFQTNESGADVSVKIYTISGRLIQELEGFITNQGFNSIPWDGLDRDGNTLANGVYLYKIIIKNGSEKKEKIEKLVVLN